MLCTPYYIIEFVEQSLFLVDRIKERTSCTAQYTHLFGTAVLAAAFGKKSLYLLVGQPRLR